MAREFDSDEEIAVWADSLDERWPERLKVRKHMVGQLVALGVMDPTVVELCSGDGRLAKEVLETISEASYVGVDASESLLEYFGRRLNLDPASRILADLRDPVAMEMIEEADAFVTLQSMHDVGGPDEILYLYQECHRRLRPKGVIVASDFVVPAGDVDSKQPGRLPIEWHLKALTDAGFAEVDCSVEVGKLGCFFGRKIGAEA